MTIFVIVIAAAAMLPGPMPTDGAPATLLGTPTTASSSAPILPNAPTACFRVYTDAVSCEQATRALVAPAGARFVCVPVEATVGEMASAY